jgi:broad specificity phosphatase PhoE
VRLLLIRHGQTPHNVTGELDTARPGAGLTPLGRTQATAVPAALRGTEIAAVHASTLVRTQLTAAPLAQDRGVDVHVHDGLREIAAGDLELRADEEAVRSYAECVGAWMFGDLDRRLPGGSSGHDFLERYDGALRSALDGHPTDATVAVFSHGAAIRAWTTRAARLDPAAAVELRMPNTGMVVLEGGPDEGWTLRSWPTEPLGGAALQDPGAHDVTGESTEEAAEEAAEGVAGTG